MSNNNNMMSKKIRTEYMKKFQDPKWETFSKCYEDSVKYRLTRRVMEQTHRPLFGDGWDSGSNSSGRSSPKMQEVNNSNAKHYTSSSESKNETAEVRKSWKPQVNGEVHTDTSASSESSAPVENGYKGAKTTNGPSESVPRHRQRHRAPRSELCYPNRDLDSDESHLPVLRKPSRANSQPPGNTKVRTPNRDNRWSFTRHDWAERHIETRDRKTPNIRASMSAGEIHRADVGVQTRRESEKHGRGLDHRRSRSADLVKCRRSELSVADERWMTEYMRCFSARLR
ncbi:centriole, cilia and spindle-associated protein-like isoform X2 [Myxocyprinus asiaticus]|nr:centriole, cilia and spindle-associated protein-like isoform X2 [Myxocyprinus asiaticus]XP_051558260.1 centriole, cilia and spindle-associated protein-like isoform X2 [Myxocyprinus asiaticus]XP_051558261.1 centriole, cilia and spindle-associated protein-like isoform X2 [Myxocyprinus asiaticus]XP_051558262.1 centriole, cilia and spindle-associated protein-like isoform X2 [Myxocyprinus asiaticus]XP_051558263.1 centriole, cilia and spindle-associated protein-like isoform X2 [Myxocyprinus asiati